MNEYVMIPAAPGTLQIEIEIDHEDGAQPRVHRLVVVGWGRNPLSSGEIDAIMIGRPDQTYYDNAGSIEDHLPEQYSIMRTIQMPNGSTVYGDDVIDVDIFMTRACRDLIERRDKILAGKMARDAPDAESR